MRPQFCAPILTCLCVASAHPSAAQYNSTFAEGLRRPVRSTDGNIWYHYGRQSNTVIVFVHGIFSNPLDGWTSVGPHGRRGAYWPEIVKQDTSFRDPSIFLAHYHTELTSGNYDVVQATEDLWNSLNDRDPSGHRVLDASNVLFVTHSTGGIVVRRMLTQYVGGLQGKSIGLALIASPSMGSNYARELEPAARIMRNRMALQLRPVGDDGNRNPFLYNLDQDFRRLLYDRALRMDGFEACENNMVFSRWWHFRHLVVDPESCSRYFGATRILQGVNHFTSVKPATPAAQVHQALLRFYRTRFRTLVELSPHLHLDSVRVRPVFDTADVITLPVTARAETFSCDSPVVVTNKHAAPNGWTLRPTAAPVLASHVNATATIGNFAQHSDTAVVTLRIQGTQTIQGTCLVPGSVTYTLTLIAEKAVTATLPYNWITDSDLTPSNPLLRISYPLALPRNARNIRWEYDLHVHGSTGTEWLDAQLNPGHNAVAGLVASARADGVSIDARDAFSATSHQQ